MTTHEDLRAAIAADPENREVWHTYADWLQQQGNVDEHEMHRVLNCGVGMVICVAQEHVETALNVLREAGEQR